MPRSSCAPQTCWRGPWRADLNAATMLGQSKTVQQAEIDAACEVIDFFRFNPHFASELAGQQPISSPGVWNAPRAAAARRLRLRDQPLQLHRDRREPAHRPRADGQYRRLEAGEHRRGLAHRTMRLLQAAGLPDGVINLVPGDAAAVSGACLAASRLRGPALHRLDRGLPAPVGRDRLAHRELPQLSAHRRRDRRQELRRRAPLGRARAVATALVRGAFEYQGQKCSAASRAYIPASLWDAVYESDRRAGRADRGRGRRRPRQLHGRGDRRARRSGGCGRRSRSRARAPTPRSCSAAAATTREGWFVEPTVVRTTDPSSSSMQRELFGPCSASTSTPTIATRRSSSSPTTRRPTR